jgi:hypothetical protein
MRLYVSFVVYALIFSLAPRPVDDQRAMPMHKLLAKAQNKKSS